MLPRSTKERSPRESATGKTGGRVHEIQRLIGRSLRAVVDMERLGERTIWIDCDVLQADGGTRTASITGAFVALMDAVMLLRRTGAVSKLPIREFLAATSAGIVDGVPTLDLTFAEDSRARVDMNIVMTESGKFVEIQGTGEGAAATGLAALADDSGIEIAALGGAPGIHSARFLGAGATSAERNARVLALLQHVPAGRRTAWFRAVIAVALPDGVVRVFEGACAGAIAEAARGTGGFGYDPIFVPEGEAGTMAEMPPEMKNRISHRARALRAAEPFLLEVFGLAVQDRVDAGGT